MKTLALLALVCAPSFAHAAKAAKFSESRCTDIRQSVLADMPHFCESARMDQERADDFRRQLNLLEKKCNQGRVAQILRRALEERVDGKDAKGCVAATEEAVLPAAQKNKARASGSDFSF